MRARDVKIFERILLHARGEVCREIEHLESDAMNGARDASAHGIHLAEVGTEEEELVKALALLGEDENLLSQIDAALAKIDAGSFGVCEACSRPIGKARLLAKPFARYCIDCRRESERTNS